jgi:phage nucleotide-binding protein
MQARMTTTKSLPNDDWGVTKVSDIERHRSFVFYGRSGTGKTTLASTFPAPILLLDIRDEGTDSISDMDVDVKEIHEPDDMEEIYWKIKKDPSRYKTIVLDTISQWQQMVIEHLAKDKKSGKRAGDWGSMRKQDWGDVAARLKEWLINFRDLSKLGMNVVFIAQDRAFNFDEDESEGAEQLTPEIGPQLMPSVVKTLNAAVSMIGNTFIRQRVSKKQVNGKEKTERRIEYCLRVGPNPVYVTKVRKPRDIEAPSVIINPTFEDIMEIIKGE